LLNYLKTSQLFIKKNKTFRVPCTWCITPRNFFIKSHIDLENVAYEMSH